MSDGVMEIPEIPQICNNEGCQLFNKLADDGTNCMEFDHPQFCPTFASAPAAQVPHNNQQQKPSRAQELVDAHWGHYVGPLLAACGVAADLLPMLEFMYKSSGIHFYKHCAEDQQEVARKAMKEGPLRSTQFIPHETDAPALNKAVCGGIMKGKGWSADGFPKAD